MKRRFGRLVLGGLMVFVLCCTLLVSTAVAADESQQISKNVYALEGNGYLVVGTKKAVLIDGKLSTSSDSEAQKTINKLAGSVPVEVVSTAAGVDGDVIDLGGKKLEVIPIPGLNPDQIALLDRTAQVLFTGDGIGSGTMSLIAEVPYTNLVGTPDQVSYAINVYKTYEDSVNSLAKAVSGLKKLKVMSADGELDAAYVSDMATLATKFVNVDRDLVLTWHSEGLNGDKTGNFNCSYGTASMDVHIPFLGLYGYRLGGTSIYQDDDSNDKFYVVDYGTHMALRDTDIQTCDLLMTDDEALVIDVDYYNPDEFFDTLFSVIGDRKLSIYITHGHGDHMINLMSLDPDRVKMLYWPGDDDAMTFGAGEFDLSVYEKAGKLTRVYDGDTFKAVGREFEVVGIPVHTPYSNLLIDKTDRVAFSGDALGTQNYSGDPNIGATDMKTYESLIDNLIAHGDDFDWIQQGHGVAPIDKDWLLNGFKAIIAAYWEDKDLYAHDNAITYFIDSVVTADQYNAIFSRGVTDAQYGYSLSIGLGKN
ncbi:MAG: MBL fold metallo-hydrolase [Oscillibacter sp.]|nr:MBL fold metallo-hydrolase [Oscillibacter sp.]